MVLRCRIDRPEAGRARARIPRWFNPRIPRPGVRNSPHERTDATESTGRDGRCCARLSAKAEKQAGEKARASVEENSAQQVIYIIPFVFGKKTGVNNALIDLWEGPTGNHFCQTTLRATCHDGILWPGVFLIQDEQGTQNNGQVIGMPIPIPIPPRADVKISAISDASNANVTALGAIMGWFEKIT